MGGEAIAGATAGAGRGGRVGGDWVETIGEDGFTIERTCTRGDVEVSTSSAHPASSDGFDTLDESTLRAILLRQPFGRDPWVQLVLAPRG
jgi:hypothetical protein